MVEDVGVGGDGEALRIGDGSVGVELGADLPGPIVFLCDCADAFGEAAAVGDGAVEEPKDGGGAECV